MIPSCKHYWGRRPALFSVDACARGLVLYIYKLCQDWALEVRTCADSITELPFDKISKSFFISTYTAAPQVNSFTTVWIILIILVKNESRTVGSSPIVSYTSLWVWNIREHMFLWPGGTIWHRNYFLTLLNGAPRATTRISKQYKFIACIENEAISHIVWKTMRQTAGLEEMWYIYVSRNNITPLVP